MNYIVVINELHFQVTFCDDDSTATVLNPIREDTSS